MNQRPVYGEPDYAIDTPGLVRNFALAGISALAAGIFFYYAFTETRPAQAVLVMGFGTIWGTCGLGAALMMLSSCRGKLKERERILYSIPLRGNETILDAGCGRVREALREVGMREVSRSGLRFNVFPPTHLMTVRKPVSGEV